MNRCVRKSSSALIPLPKSAAARHALHRGRLLARHHRAPQAEPGRGRAAPVEAAGDEPDLHGPVVEGGVVAAGPKAPPRPTPGRPAPASSGTAGRRPRAASGRPGSAASGPTPPPCRSWVTTVSTSWTLRPGRTTRLVTANGAAATGRSSSRVSRDEPPAVVAGQLLDRTAHGGGDRPAVERVRRPRPPGQVGRDQQVAVGHEQGGPAGRSCSAVVGRRRSRPRRYRWSGTAARAYHRVASGRVAGGDDDRDPVRADRTEKPRSTMAERTAEIDIDGSPEAVWALVGDFGGIAGWMPGMESCRVEGDNRILDTHGHDDHREARRQGRRRPGHHLRHRRRGARRVPRGDHHRDRRRVRAAT